MITIGENKTIAVYKGSSEINKVYLGSNIIFDSNGSDLFSNPVPNDEIWYTTTDSSRLVGVTSSGYGANLSSNTYTDGKGVMKFDGDINNVPEDAFSSLGKLQTIAFPDNVTAIHGKAFSNCSGLTTIQLGKGLLTMNDNYQGAGGSFTFDDCYNLSKIVSLKPVAANIDNWCFHDFRPVGSTVPCVLAIPSGATGYNNWKYTIYDDTDATADLTFYSFTTKTLEESDCLFLNT